EVPQKRKQVWRRFRLFGRGGRREDAFEARQHFQLVTGRAGSASIGRRQSAGVDWSPRHHDRLTDLFAPDGPCHRSLSNKRSHDVILGKGDPMAVMKRRTMARMRLA